MGLGIDIGHRAQVTLAHWREKLSGGKANTGSVAVAVLLVVLLSGCQQPVDTAAVQAYVAAVTAASPSLDAFTSDLVPRCEAIRNLQATTRLELLSEPEPNPTPSAIAAGDALSRALNDSGGVARANCILAATAADQWEKRDHIIVAYVQALGAIAGVNTKPSGLDKITAEMSQDGLMSKSDAAPFATIGTDITSLLIEGRRDAVLQRFSRDADPPLQIAVASLVDASTQYRNILQAERSILNNMYHTHIRDVLRTRKNTTDTFDLYVVRNAWAAQSLAIDIQEQKATSYEDAIRRIAATNHSLVESENSGVSLVAFAKDLSIRLGPIVSDISALQKH